MKRKYKSLFVIDAEIPSLTKDEEGKLRGGYNSLYSGSESRLNDKKKNDDCNCGCGTTERPNNLPNGNCNCNCMCKKNDKESYEDKSLPCLTRNYETDL